jgi:chromosome segregation ATPase
MPKLTHSPPKLNKSLSMSDSDVDKLLKKDNALLETIHVTQRDSKRRRIAELESESETLAIRKIIREELDGLMSVLQQQNKRMDVLEQHVSDIKCQNNTTIEKNIEIEKSIQFISEKVDDLQMSLKNLERNRKEIAAQISQTENKCDSLERFNRKTSIQIRNAPKGKGENKEKLFDMVSQLATSLSINLQSTELQDAYRMPSKQDQRNSTIVAEFSTTTQDKIPYCCKTL